MPSDNTAQLVDSARRRHELTRAKRRADRCGGGLCVRGRDRHAAGIGQRQGCLPATNRSGPAAGRVRHGIAAATGGLPVRPAAGGRLDRGERPGGSIGLLRGARGSWHRGFRRRGGNDGARARDARGQRAHGAWRVPTLRILVCCTMLQSLTFGALPVGLAAVSAAGGLPNLAGVLLATLTVGGIMGTFGPTATASTRRYVRMTGRFAAVLILTPVPLCRTRYGCHQLSNPPAMPPLVSRTVHLADASATLPRRDSW